MTSLAMAFPAAPDRSSSVGPGRLGDAGTRLLAGPPNRRETLAEHCERLGALSLPRTDAARATMTRNIAASGLVGRGGGEFPLVGKLTAAFRSPGVPIIVVNGSESERASRKDALLLRSRPHLVLDGAVLAAAIVGAHQIVVYLHKDSGATYTSVMEAVHERIALPNVPGIVVTTCASGFVAGESSAIVSALSGGPPVPRRRSVPAAVIGVDGRPTVVSNVETLAHLGLIGRFGAEWFRSAGRPGTPGTTLLTLAGYVTSPGLVVEVSAPVSVRTILVENAGLDREPAAVLIGGYGGRWVSGEAAWNAPVDRAILRRAGVSLGCGSLRRSRPTVAGLRSRCACSTISRRKVQASAVHACLVCRGWQSICARSSRAAQLAGMCGGRMNSRSPSRGEARARTQTVLSLSSRVRWRYSAQICGATFEGCRAAGGWPDGSPCQTRRTSGSCHEERSCPPYRQPSAVRRAWDLRAAGPRPPHPGCMGICRCRDERDAFGTRPSAGRKRGRGMSRACAVANGG